MKMKNKNYKELICLKTGAKAKVIKFFDHNAVSYVKVNINMKFQNSSFQILKTIQLDNMEKEFNYITQ